MNTKKEILRAADGLEKLAVGETLVQTESTQFEERQGEEGLLLTQRKTNEAKLPSRFQTTNRTVLQLLQNLGENLKNEKQPMKCEDTE